MASREEALHYQLKVVLATLTPIPPVAWPNQRYKPITGVSYIEPRVLWNDSDWGEIGPIVKRHRGLYRVTVHGPIDNGIADAAVADAIIEGFTAEVINFDAFRIRIGSFDGSPGLPYRNSAFEDGSWNLTPVTIPWWSDETE